MVFSFLPIVGVFTYRIINFSNNMHNYRRVPSLTSKLGLIYLLIGLIIFFTGLFDTSIGKYIFEAYWISAVLLSSALCMKEF